MSTVFSLLSPLHWMRLLVRRRRPQSFSIVYPLRVERLASDNFSHKNRLVNLPQLLGTIVQMWIEHIVIQCTAIHISRLLRLWKIARDFNALWQCLEEKGQGAVNQISQRYILCSIFSNLSLWINRP